MNKFIKDYYSECCKTDVYVTDKGLVCNGCKKHVYNTISKKYYLKKQMEIKAKEEIKNL